MTETVLSAIRPLLPGIAAAAGEVDRQGAVDPGVVARLQDTGFFAMLQPRSFGGLEADPEEFLTATREIAAACTSTGWLAGMLGVNSWHLALFDGRAQDDVWGSDSRALLCESYAPTARLERVGKNFRLSGRWRRCTGIHHVSWLMAGALLVGEDGAAQDFMVALVPRDDYAIESSWNPLGLRGIGADDVVVSGAIVPPYRAFGFVSEEQRGTLAPLYRLPQPTLYTHTGTAPLLGAALGVLASHRPSDSTTLSAVAMASADLEVSVLQMRRNLTELMDCARVDSTPGPELLLRARRDQVLGSERAVRAIQLFVERQDVEADDRDDRLERVWRDVQTARIHVANHAERVLSVVGQSAFGLTVDELIL